MKFLLPGKPDWAFSASIVGVFQSLHCVSSDKKDIDARWVWG